MQRFAGLAPNAAHDCASGAWAQSSMAQAGSSAREHAFLAVRSLKGLLGQAGSVPLPEIVQQLTTRKRSVANLSAKSGTICYRRLHQVLPGKSPKHWGTQLCVSVMHLSSMLELARLLHARQTLQRTCAHDCMHACMHEHRAKQHVLNSHHMWASAGPACACLKVCANPNP